MLNSERIAIGFIFIFSLLCAIGKAQSIQKDSLHTGDLVFLNLDGGPLCEAIESVTPHYKGHPFSHVGLIFIKNNKPYVVEAAGKQVQINPLNIVLQRSPHPAFIGRLKTQWKRLGKKAVQFAKKQLDKPYDGDFLMNNGKYYCSELVYDAFKAANHGRPVFRLFPMTYKSPGDSTYFPAWAHYFEKRHEPVPQGKPGCNPGSIATSGKLKMYVLK